MGRRCQGDLPPRAPLHRLCRVADQVHQHLLDLDPVDPHKARARVDMLDDLDAAVTAVREGQGHGFVQHRPDLRDVAGQLAFGDEVAQALDNLAGTQDLLARLADQSHRPAPVDDGQALRCAEIVGCCR